MTNRADTVLPAASRAGQKTPSGRPESAPAGPVARRSVGEQAWKAVRTGMAIVAVTIGSLAVVVAVASHLAPAGQYTVFGHPVLTVLSGSMAPTIRTGDLVYDDRLRPGQAAHLKAGQIITFRATPGGHQTFTHRIHAVVSVNGAVAYQTKGDANPSPDATPVLPSQVVGLYRGKIPYGGYFLNALHQPLALVLLLAAPCLWLLSGWFLGLARADQADQGRAPPRRRRGPPT
jgi:signal peptidase I